MASIAGREVVAGATASRLERALSPSDTRRKRLKADGLQRSRHPVSCAGPERSIVAGERCARLSPSLSIDSMRPSPSRTGIDRKQARLDAGDDKEAGDMLLENERVVALRLGQLEMR